MIVNSRVQIGKFPYRVSNLINIEFKNSILLYEMNIYRLITHAQQVEGDKLVEIAIDYKKGQNRQLLVLPTEIGFWNCSKTFDSQCSIPQDYIRSSISKSPQRLSGIRNYLTSTKCGKNHLGECFIGKKGCFGYGKTGHKFRDFPY